MDGKGKHKCEAVIIAFDHAGNADEFAVYLHILMGFAVLRARLEVETDREGIVKAMRTIGRIRGLEPDEMEG